MDGGSGKPADRLFPVVYAELREIAECVLRRHRESPTLQPTMLVHELYLKLVDQSSIDQRDRIAFLGVAASAMRQILVDCARARNAAKRGGGWQRVTLAHAEAGSEVAPIDVLAIDEALERLGELDERRARVVELRFFAGLTSRETADVLAVSLRTVEHDWQIAKAWLSQVLSGEKPL